jgi:hypothetical protein
MSQVTVELVDITMIGGGEGGGGGGDEEEGDVDLEEVDALRVVVKVVNRNFFTGLSHLDLDWCLGPCEHTAVAHHCSGPLELYGGGDGGGVPPQSSVECVVDLPLSSLVDFVDSLLLNNDNDTTSSGSSGGSTIDKNSSSTGNGEIKEIWMNVTAVLSEDTSWAPAGHEIIKVH